MKRSNFIFLVLGLGIIFFGCSKDDFLPPELDQNDQAEVALKAAKVKTEFMGVSSPDPGGQMDMTAKPLPNGKLKAQFYTVWHDDPLNPEHWMVKGQTTWEVKQIIEAGDDLNFKYWGKCELLLDDNKGVWELSWHGYWITSEAGPQLIAYAVGQGKSGEVKGMVGKWTYTFNFIEGVYDFEGYYK